MKILCVELRDDRLYFTLDGDGPAEAEALSPARGADLVLGRVRLNAVGGSASIPRTVCGRDGLFLRYRLSGRTRCVERIADPEFDGPYPETDTKKGLQIRGDMIDDAVELGVRHAAHNVCIGDLMRSGPDGCIPFEHDGRTYYFDRETVESTDRALAKMTENGIVVTLILLCAKHWGGDTPADMTGALLHPDYVDDRKAGGGLLSAFNMVTDEGVRHYAAFIAFLARRYGAPGGGHGRAAGMIISNEVNSHWIWSNAGEKTAAEFAREYTAALRLAWQAATSVWGGMRIYASFDHFWTGAQKTDQPLRYTGARYMMEHIAAECRAEGDCGWNVAAHPYPENLSRPDFWNDATAPDSPDAYRVTFKNLGVLRDFLRREEMRFRGEPRRVILSEQGFNSRWTPESEALQACAYGRAYRVVMEIPEIDSFILHAHCDNAEEFGLNLGLWRRNRDKPGLDGRKPIWYVMRAIDKKDESGKYHWERY